jgi:heme/copper-type cytochrome/quinol oxidase subunit 4
MNLFSNRPVWLTWAVLMTATVLTTWVLTAESIDRRLALAAIFAVAAWKVRLVMTDFIELREAPVAGRLVFEGWAVAVPLLIVLVAWH